MPSLHRSRPSALQKPTLSTALPTRRDVEQAAERLQPWVRQTPLVHSRHRRAWLKLENLQITGAFKVRGALNALLLQRERGDERPVMAASAGNHGAGIAWAAQQLGLRATVVVPHTAPESKIKRIESVGARVIFQGERFDESLLWAQHEARRRGARFVHAFDDPEIIAGQGTLALELLKIQPERVLIPIGGGGLAAGITLALQGRGVQCIGVQVEGLDAMSLALGPRPCRIEPKYSLADGLRVGEPGRMTRVLCKAHLDGLVTVTEDQVRRSMVSLATREGLTVEGAAAVSVAALDQVPRGRNIAIVSGGNVDAVTFRKLMRRHHQEGLFDQEN